MSLKQYRNIMVNAEKRTELSTRQHYLKKKLFCPIYLLGILFRNNLNFKQKISLVCNFFFTISWFRRIRLHTSLDAVLHSSHIDYCNSFLTNIARNKTFLQRVQSCFVCVIFALVAHHHFLYLNLKFKYIPITLYYTAPLYNNNHNIWHGT